MYWNGDVVAKGEIVEHVDGEKHHGTGDHSSQRDSALPEEERWMAGGEVSWPCDESRYNELDEGDQEPSHNRQVISRRSQTKLDVPLSGSHLMAQQSAKVQEGDDGVGH